MLGEGGVKNFASFEGVALIPFFLCRAIIPLLVSFYLGVMVLFSDFLPLPVSLKLPVLPAFILSLISLISLLLLYFYSREFFKRFLFELRDDLFFSKKGVVTPSYTMIPYENIQDVHVSQGYVEKLLGLSTVCIYTATFSGRGSDAIPGLSRENAEAFKDALFARIKGVKKVVD